MFVLSIDGEFLTRHGQANIGRHGLKALQRWSEGEKLVRPPADQYEWRYVSCNQCEMTPLMGQRYSCSICEYFDLCSACEEQKGHQHPLILQDQPEDY